MTKVKLEKIGNQKYTDVFLKQSELEYGIDSDVSNPEYFKFKFLQNPAGSSVSLTLMEDHKSVGRLVLMPRAFRCGKNEISCTYPTELLIQKDSRGIEKLLKLISKFKIVTKEDPFILVTPNKNALDIWRGLSGLKQKRKLKVQVIPLKPSKFFFDFTNSKILGFFDTLVSIFFVAYSHLINFLSPYHFEVCNIEESNDFDMDNFFSSEELRGDRSNIFLKWRTSYRPSTSYQFVKVKKNKRVIGYGLFSKPKNYGNLKPLILLDMVAVPKHRKAVLKSLGRFGILQHKDIDLLLFMAVIPNLKFHFLSCLPFISVPNRFLPDANDAFFELRSNLISNKDIYITLFDCDMF